MVLTSTWASMRDCHFLTKDLSLSEVISIPWKLVRQFFPEISSHRSLILRKAWSSASLLRSANETSKTRPLRASLAFFKPWVRLTKVLPMLRTSKTEGALTSYQSLREKGSTIFFLRPFLPFERRLREIDYDTHRFVSQRFNSKLGVGN